MIDEISQFRELKTIIAECQKIFAGIKHKHTTSDVTGLDEALENAANIVYTTRDEYDQLEKNGALDSNATYVITDESDNITDSSVQLWNTSSSLAQQGKYLSYSDQNGGKYLSLMNSSDNTAVAHAKLVDGESGEGMDVDADKVKTVDSKGILVEALGETTAQALIDEVAKRVIDLTGRMSTTETGLQSANDAITSLNSNKQTSLKVKDISIKTSNYNFGNNMGGVITNIPCKSLIGDFEKILNAEIATWSACNTHTIIMLDSKGTYLTIWQAEKTSESELEIRFVYV